MYNDTKDDVNDEILKKWGLDDLPCIYNDGYIHFSSVPYDVPYGFNQRVYSEPEVDKDTPKLYTKDDLKKIFNCEDDKALRLLKFMKQTNYAVKIGNTYYIDPEQLKAFLEFIKGKSVNI